MASTTKFGSIETRIRRDLINDNDADQYRWSVAAVMSQMNQAVKDIATRMNPWAAHDEFGDPICNLNTDAISTNCDANPPSGEIPAATIATLRATIMPLDDRYADAVAYIAAAKLYMTDDSDTANATKSANYLQIGKELAQS